MIIMFARESDQITVMKWHYTETYQEHSWKRNNKIMVG